MLIAHLSDCHILGGEALAYGRVDTAGALRAAVAAVNALPARPDAILVTGDLTEDGSPGAYDAFKAIAGDLPAPLLPVVGNHDDRAALARAFDLEACFDLQQGFIQYAVGAGDFRILVIDSQTPGEDRPSLCRDRLAWVEAELADPRPTLIALHHPPFPAGVDWMEPPDRHWAASLAALVARHPAVVRIACGHVHRAVTRVWAGAVAMSAPSTAQQVFLDLTPAGPRRVNQEAPGFLLHQWDGQDLSSFGVAIPGLAQTVDI